MSDCFWKHLSECIDVDTRSLKNDDEFETFLYKSNRDWKSLVEEVYWFDQFELLGKIEKYYVYMRVDYMPEPPMFYDNWELTVFYTQTLNGLSALTGINLGLTLTLEQLAFSKVWNVRNNLLLSRPPEIHELLWEKACDW